MAQLSFFFQTHQLQPYRRAENTIRYRRHPEGDVQRRHPEGAIQKDPMGPFKPSGNGNVSFVELWWTELRLQLIRRFSTRR